MMVLGGGQFVMSEVPLYTRDLHPGLQGARSLSLPERTLRLALDYTPPSHS